MARWTTEKEKPLDTSLFRNGGLSYWEAAEEPYKPSVCSILSIFSLTVATHCSSCTDPQAIFAPAHSSPTAANGNGIDSTPLPTSTPPSGKAGPAIAKDLSTPTPKSNEPSLPALSVADIKKTGVSPTDASLEQSLSTTTSDSEKLQIALKEIDKLRSDLEEARGPQATGLRKRGGATTGAGGAEVAVEKAKEVIAGNQGVPVEVVAGLVVAVFVLTYMFF